MMLKWKMSMKLLNSRKLCWGYVCVVDVVPEELDVVEEDVEDVL